MTTQRVLQTRKMSSTGEPHSLGQIPSKRTRIDWIGALDASTDAHQMLLNLLEPENARYAGSDFGNIDARVQYAVACRRVADPLARHQMALRQNNERLIAAQNAFFSSEQENGGRKSANDPRTCTPDFLPPLLVLQGTKDDDVTPDRAARFVDECCHVGGGAMLRTFKARGA
jgi:hypothetical protein